jgi:hypothetical protein
MPEVTLPSSGGKCKVRTLGIFELDRIHREFIGPFTYEITIFGGAKKTAEYDIGKYEELGREPPRPPDIPEHEIRENTPEWYQFRDSQLYKAAEHHNRMRFESVGAYCDNVIAYILENCLEDPDDVKLIVTKQDWEEVRFAALVPQITERMVINILRDTFQAQFNDQEIIDALDSIPGGSGKYNPIRLWEIQWANEMGYSDSDLALIEVDERARRVCGKFLTKWLEALELDKMRKEREMRAT